VEELCPPENKYIFTVKAISLIMYQYGLELRKFLEQEKTQTKRTENTPNQNHMKNTSVHPQLLHHSLLHLGRKQNLTLACPIHVDS